jgi:hypothetical protein
MGTAVDIIRTRPILVNLDQGSSRTNPRSPRHEVLPASVFQTNVSGVNQNFQLGVLDGTMVIVRSNPKGGHYVLRTGVLAGGQPKLASEAAIKKFAEMLRTPSSETTEFLRATGALQTPAASNPAQPKLPKVSLFEANLNTSLIARQNGSNALTNVLELRNGKGEGSVAITYTKITANNVGSNPTTLIPANSDSLSFKYGLSGQTSLLGGVSAVNTAGVQSTTIGLAVHSSLKLNDLTFSGEMRAFYNATTGSVTSRPTIGVELIKPFGGGVYGKASLSARVPWSMGSPAGGLQTAAFVGLGVKSKNNFFVEAGVGTGVAGDAVSLRSVDGVVGYKIQIGYTINLR